MQLRFQKPIEYFSLLLIPFPFLLLLSSSLSLLSLLLSMIYYILFIWLYFHIKLIMYYYFTRFVFVLRYFNLFIIFKFIFVPFSSDRLFTFLTLFFSFVLQMSPSCPSFGCYFLLFYPYQLILAFFKSSEKNARTSPNYRENSGPFCLCCCVIISLKLVSLLYFYPPSHQCYLTGQQNPETNNACSQGLLRLIC